MCQAKTVAASAIAAWFLSCGLGARDLQAAKRYYRGNTHTHSYPYSRDVVDTTNTPARVIARYKAHGYDFLVFTEHDTWWDAGAQSTPDFTVIDGCEVQSGARNEWGHFTALNLKTLFSAATLTRQQTIDAIHARGAIPFLNHPRLATMPITASEIINGMCRGLAHMEAFNALTAVQPPPDDISVWDSVLATGRLIYGVASDDSHAWWNDARAWIMVHSGSIAADSLVQAIENGDFYGSTGVVLDSVACSSQGIYVHSTNGEVVRFIGKSGVELATFLGNEAAYQVRGDEVYVRAEVANSLRQRAWTQPILVLPAGVSTGAAGARPLRFELFQNYPDPVNPGTTISYGLPRESNVALSVYDILGRRLETLVHGDEDAGYHRVHFDTSHLASGIYYYRLQAGTFVAVKKLAVVR